jgi:hypothetical protein
VTHVVRGQYLGTLDAAWFRAEFPHRDPVDDGAWAEAVRVWRAFTAPDPLALDRLRPQLIEWPYLPAAVARHLQEFPWMETGLSRTETQVLEALASGPLDLLAAFHASHHEREQPVFLGDLVFAWHVARLSRGDHALVTRLDGRRLELPREASAEYWEQQIVLTPLADRVLAGQADRVKVAGLDRWLGGVHLQGHDTRWRWDDRQARLVLMNGAR